MIEISFDPEKDKANRRKHGISLAMAKDFDMDAAWLAVDNSQDYGEDRFIGVSWLRGSLHTMVFTVRSNGFRVINLRSSNPEEIESYGENS